MKLFDSLVKSVKNPIMDISDMIRVTEFLNLLAGLIYKLVDQNKYASDEEYEKYIIFSIVWSFGGLLEHPDRVLFHEHLVQKNVPIPAKQN